jgi:hypothetical protein
VCACVLFIFIFIKPFLIKCVVVEVIYKLEIITVLSCYISRRKNLKHEVQDWMDFIFLNLDRAGTMYLMSWNQITYAYLNVLIVVATVLNCICRFYNFFVIILRSLSKKDVNERPYYLSIYCHYSQSLILWKFRLQTTIIKRTYWDLPKK